MTYEICLLSALIDISWYVCFSCYSNISELIYPNQYKYRLDNIGYRSYAKMIFFFKVWRKIHVDVIFLCIKIISNHIKYFVISSKLLLIFLKISYWTSTKILSPKTFSKTFLKILNFYVEVQYSVLRSFIEVQYFEYFKQKF